MALLPHRPVHYCRPNAGLTRFDGQREAFIRHPALNLHGRCPLNRILLRRPRSIHPIINGSSLAGAEAWFVHPQLNCLHVNPGGARAGI